MTKNSPTFNAVYCMKHRWFFCHFTAAVHNMSTTRPFDEQYCDGIYMPACGTCWLAVI